MSDLISVMLNGTSAFENNQTPNADLEKLKNTRIFHRAIVIETLCDVSLRKDPPESLSQNDKAIFSKAPRNSLVCRLLTDENNLSTTSDILCFPFFSSHFALPVKTGEQVWILREVLFSGTSRNRSYWISRVPDELGLEDANFTPFTREVLLSHTGSAAPDRILEIPNSRSGADSTQIIFGKDDALINLIKNASENSQIVHEPVPRFTKRPGDTVIQGSNNTAIVLGTDRGFTNSERPVDLQKSNSSNTPPEKSGSIDVVAGRGRYFDTQDNEAKQPRKKAQSKGVKNSTQPFIAKNSLGKFETDKDPAKTQDPDNGNPDPGNSRTNPGEGDPDFLVDASRIYISENSEIDKKLGLDEIYASPFENEVIPQVGPSIAIKSDHVRIVARQVPNSFIEGKLPPKFEDFGARGTIRIVKEGDKDNDLATITIDSDGTIQISGPKIFLGRSTSDGGEGQGPGPGESQPYVKYKQLEDLWNSTMDAMSNFCDTILTHVTPGYGSPSIQINQAATDLKGKISTLKSDISKVKSNRIFGE